MIREEVLDKAKTIITKDRNDQYGEPEQNFGRISRLWSAYLDVDLSPVDVAAMMIMVKVARVRSGHGKEDNWIDAAGYAACGAEVSSALERRKNDE